MRRAWLAVLASLLMTGGLVAIPASADGGPARAARLVHRIEALPHVTRVRERAAPQGYRFFVVDFTQPDDHDRPGRGSFTQRLTLLHRGSARPVVVFTSGYGVETTPERSEPTAIVDGNQISIEHRFFAPSRPAHPDWARELTIRQAAADEHAVIASFRHLYRAHWLSTGPSKGGMTATYHRRFYPDDVDGTIAYVAPDDVVDGSDRYDAFLALVGSDQQCRDDLTALQRRVLRQRAAFTAKARRISHRDGYTYTIAHGLPRAMEAAVVDLSFAFWQYTPQSGCASLPDARSASVRRVWDFFERHSSLTAYADQRLAPYVPYYVQAASQLGSPEPYEDRIGDLLEHPGNDVARSFVPVGLRPRHFDAAAMPDIDHWVRTRSRRMLFLYGSNDPWSAEPFGCGRTGDARGCSRYYVAAGTHRSTIADLARPERDRATSAVLRWAGLSADDPARRRIERTGAPRPEPALRHIRLAPATTASRIRE